VKNGTTLVLFAVVLILGLLLFWDHAMRRELTMLRAQIQSVEAARAEADGRILRSVDETADHLLLQMSTMEQQLEKMAREQDLRKDLPEDYIEAVENYIDEQIEVLVAQRPVFTLAWEIVSVRFWTPNLVSVRCRDGQVGGDLLLVIYPRGGQAYVAEVLYSTVRPWAG
jgi:hypothetical protein